MSNTQTVTIAPAGTWGLDAVHSAVGFEVEYLGGTFKGTFDEIDATLVVGDDSVSLEGSAKVASVNVKDENLAGHLQSPDFFDAERYPQLSFEAREISRSGDELTIAGELTLKGHTEAVEIKGHVNDPAPDPYGGERFGLQLETTVDRTKFGINWNNPLPSGDASLANDVTIIVDLQLSKES